MRSLIFKWRRLLRSQKRLARNTVQASLNLIIHKLEHIFDAEVVVVTRKWGQGETTSYNFHAWEKHPRGSFYSAIAEHETSTGELRSWLVFLTLHIGFAFFREDEAGEFAPRAAIRTLDVPGGKQVVD